MNIFEKVSNNTFGTMILYRVKYTGSESDIQNNDLFYKMTNKCQNTFDFQTFQEINFSKLLFYYMYKLYNSYFVLFVNFVNLVVLGSLYFYIVIYYTCRSLTRVGLLHVRSAVDATWRVSNGPTAQSAEGPE